MREIISKVEQRYRVKLPRKVLAVDYGDRGDLYIRFKHVEKPKGEPAKDGLAVFFYESEGNSTIAVEILDVNKLIR